MARRRTSISASTTAATTFQKLLTNAQEVISRVHRAIADRQPIDRAGLHQRQQFAVGLPNSCFSELPQDHTNIVDPLRMVRRSRSGRDCVNGASVGRLSPVVSFSPVVKSCAILWPPGAGKRVVVYRIQIIDLFVHDTPFWITPLSRQWSPDKIFPPFLGGSKGLKVFLRLYE
jgi:hypothetical protein